MLSVKPRCSPLASIISRVRRNEGVQEWNALVDEYIASGVDKRDPVEIENIAKIGLAGGPLHRKCEGPDCHNLEGRNNVKISVCAGCHKVSSFVSVPIIF